MRRWMVAVIVAVIGLATPQKASAQFATFDASNLAQSILSFLQDGDNMANNTYQFLENIGVMKEQLEFLKEMNERYSEVRENVYKAQSVIRLARYYETTAMMFSRYVERLEELDTEELRYYQVRSLVNEGFQYLLMASREVKRAREYLSSKSNVSEEERRAALKECEKQVCKTNAAMYEHIVETYAAIDNGRVLAANMKSMDEAFKMKY